MRECVGEGEEEEREMEGRGGWGRETDGERERERTGRTGWWGSRKGDRVRVGRGGGGKRGRVVDIYTYMYLQNSSKLSAGPYLPTGRDDGRHILQ